MPRASKLSSFINFQFEDLHKQIRESTNVVRWNPVLAIEWMENARSKITTDVLVKEWNNAAKQINNTIESIERSSYYTELSYWYIRTPGQLFESHNSYFGSKRLEFIEEVFSFEEFEKILKSKL